ncbi:hypothetical protein QO002_003667 [Pararhizobium capsulatum DSM 1112]|uniref:Oxygen tolerance n=1 Tax=Pararhizobium capsulatum DSM 1112 TaxID=1121113 RepID=A0ABU0BTF2_9HYPH|nr:BatD family protein [Pararhizobium capsulatum]MDQ0321529.1 hypothetical protein [Pararhizobium capsulatum DSM 1112]
MSTRTCFLHMVPALMFWCIATTTSALAADPIARATLQSKGTLYVGQQVLVDVDVLVPNYFLQPPQFPEIDLPGAIVTLQDGRAMNLNETIGEDSYSGIRRTYVITPQQAGNFTLPPAEITFGYAAVPGQMTQGKTSLPSLSFTVEAAPGSATQGANQGPGVVAAKVTLTQDFDRDTKTLKAGDTLTRTITIRAEGLRAMMIPEPEFETPESIRVYRQDPVLSEEMDRTDQPVAGVRKDVAQYLFQDVGQFDLPAVELSWFDPATAKTESASAPAVTVSVAAAPAATTELAPAVPEPEAAPFNWFLACAMAAAALISGAVIWILAQGLSRLEISWETRRSDQRESEAAYFRHVEQACHGGSPAEIENALDRWSRKAGVVPLRPWLSRYADEETRQAYEAQQRSVYADNPLSHADPHALAKGLQKARNGWFARVDRKPRRWHSRVLPQLNPDWESR